MSHVVAEPCFDCKYTDCGPSSAPSIASTRGPQITSYIHPEEMHRRHEACASPSAPSRRSSTKTTCPDDWKDFTQARNAEESSSAR